MDDKQKRRCIGDINQLIGVEDIHKLPTFSPIEIRAQKPGLLNSGFSRGFARINPYFVIFYFDHRLPIIVLKNDHNLKIYNGDVGIIMKDENGLIKAFFPDGDGNVKSISPASLPEHATAFAMTVHKHKAPSSMTF